MWKQIQRTVSAGRRYLPTGASMKTETLDAIGTTGVKVSVVGAVGSGWGALSVNELAAVIGAIVAIGGLVITWYYKREAARLRRAEHAGREQERLLRMEMMRRTGVVIPDAESCELEGADA